jgi:XisH protein
LGKRKGFIDLGAEIVCAERGLEKIAIEIKTFSKKSDVRAFEDALGQFLLYKVALRQKEFDRILYLAVPKSVFDNLFDDRFFLGVLEEYKVLLIVYDETQAIIEKWIKQ